MTARTDGSPPVLCACGKPLHYTDPANEQRVHDIVAQHGPDIEVTAGGRRWIVQRHYIALHGLRAVDLPTLGFPEVVRAD